MKHVCIATAMAIGLAVSAWADDYRVTIDGKVYTFTRGVKREIVLPSGQRVSVSVSPVETKEFREHGISFSYPSDMEIEQESSVGVKHITAEAADSTLFMLQIYPGEVAPADVKRDLLAGLKEQYGAAGARFPARPTQPCQRVIGGRKYQGVKLLFSLFNTPHENEIYTMKKNGKTLALVFHHAVEDKNKATPRFNVITSTFK